MNANAALAERLRACAASGDFGPLADAYADEAVLDLSLPGGRHRLSGPAAIVRTLADALPGAGRLDEWRPEAHPDGLAIWLERIGEDGSALRQRHYLRASEGRVDGHWVYSARPQAAPPAEPLPEPAEELFAALGPLAERVTLASSGNSGNRIDRLTLADGRGLIAKRIVPGVDWLGRATGDDGREALLVTDGIHERMPDVIDTAVVAAIPDGDAWWVVMRDVSDVLLDESSPISRETHRFVLDAAARMWSEWDGEEVPHLASTRRRIGFTGLAIAEAERDELDVLPKQLEAAWDAFAEVADTDVAGAVLELVADPGPLAEAIDARGRTLVHGDLRDENIGLDGGRLVLLDFGLATLSHPALDLGWYMCHDVWRIEATHDEVVEDFRRALGDRDDPLALELGLISGLVSYGWIMGHSAVVHPDPQEQEWAREELGWWVPRVRRAFEAWR